MYLKHTCSRRYYTRYGHLNDSFLFKSWCSIKQNPKRIRTAKKSCKRILAFLLQDFFSHIFRLFRNQSTDNIYYQIDLFICSPVREDTP